MPVFWAIYYFYVSDLYIQTKIGYTVSMLKQITLDKRIINYNLRVSRRARRLRLAIYGDGRLVVTQPHRASSKFVEDFIREKAAWIIRRQDYFKKFPTPLISGPARRADYLAKREAARVLVYARLEYFNEFYKFKYKTISIRNQSTRWGSCSRLGNLSFNYRLVTLPPLVADYVIVHELCHLREFNHSSRFWQLVAQTIPDYAERRRELRLKMGGL